MKMKTNEKKNCLKCAYGNIVNSPIEYWKCYYFSMRIGILNQLFIEPIWYKKKWRQKTERCPIKKKKNNNNLYEKMNEQKLIYY